MVLFILLCVRAGNPGPNDTSISCCFGSNFVARYESFFFSLCIFFIFMDRRIERKRRIKLEDHFYMWKVVATFQSDDETLNKPKQTIQNRQL